MNQQEMTLRDHFAAQAIHVLKPPDDCIGERERRDSHKRWAKRVYEMADALIAERNRK